MKFYVRLEFTPEGTDPFEIITLMKSLGYRAVLGDYDFAFDFEKPDEYREAVLKMHEALKGKGVRYSLATKKS